MTRAVNKVVHGARWRLAALLERARRTAYPRAVRQAWSKARAEQLSYTTDRQLHQLLEVVQRTAPSGALILEAGCARGGSAILMCAAKSPQRPMRVYDLFEMLPPPSEHDGEDMKARYAEIAAGKAVGLGGGRYYLYEDDLLGTVAHNFARYGYPVESNNIQLIKGKVQDTLTVAEPVALAHIDVDWYEPVTACLERVMPRLIVGGAVALHAYSDWSGCRKATDDYFSRAGREGLDFDVSAGHLLVTRTRAEAPESHKDPWNSTAGTEVTKTLSTDAKHGAEVKKDGFQHWPATAQPKTTASANDRYRTSGGVLMASPDESAVAGRWGCGERRRAYHIVMRNRGKERLPSTQRMPST